MIVPVVGFKVKPLGVDENVPPDKPVTTGV